MQNERLRRLGYLVLIVLILVGFLAATKKSPPQNRVGAGIGERYGFHFPFALDNKAADFSYISQMKPGNKNVPYIVKEPKIEWINQIKDDAKKYKWQLLDDHVFKDGGSEALYYFQKPGLPAVELFFKWDIGNGGYESLSISFIHPLRIGDWLLNLQSQATQQGKEIDVAKLMDCSGKLVRTANLGETECQK